MSVTLWLAAAIGLGVVSLGFALYLYAWVNRQDAGGERERQIAGYIQEGARAYLAKLYKTLAVLVAVLGVAIGLIFSLDMIRSVAERTLVVAANPLEGVWTAVAFAALHFVNGSFNPMSLLTMTLAGLFFGLLAEKSGGLALPIGAHFGWNWAERS